MADTFNTVVVMHMDWVEVVSIHEQNGSAQRGYVPIKNIPDLIIELQAKYESCKRT